MKKYREPYAGVPWRKYRTTGLEGSGSFGPIAMTGSMIKTGKGSTTEPVPVTPPDPKQEQPPRSPAGRGKRSS
jgi:hypothetical protein